MDVKSAMWVIHIKTARWIMAKALEDKALFFAYRANIAMLIYDDQMAGTEEGSRFGPPTNLGTKDGCNFIAERIIDLVFSK